MKRLRGHEIVADARQYAGTINAEKCIAYLRGVGVEVEDATADAWLDAQAAHRFLGRMKQPALTIERWSCRCGEMEGFALKGEKAPRPAKGASTREPARCDACGTTWCGMSRWYVVTRDGTEIDYRPEEARIVPFDWKELIALHRTHPQEEDA